MTTEWNQAKLQELIDDQVEESQSLEYKAAGALNTTKKDEFTNELSKDVSAMANAAGGTIIYGIAEFRDEPRKHLPEKLSPIVRSDFNKERLERIINSNIKPRIDGVAIHPVALDTGSDHVAYVIEIPQSTTAHQATDFRYHRRYNFEVLRMLDHEIRDVMGRSQHPRIVLELELSSAIWEVSTGEKHPVVYLNIFAVNRGSKYAKYVTCFISVPKIILWDTGSSALSEFRKNELEQEDFACLRTTLVNKSRDYEPILPGLTRELGQLRIFYLDAALQSERCRISWTIHADNAPVESATILARDIPTNAPSGK